MPWISISRTSGRSEIMRSGMKLRKPFQIGALIYIPLCLEPLCPLCPVGQEQTTFPNWKQKTDMNLKICSGWLEKIKNQQWIKLYSLIFRFKLNVVASFLTVFHTFDSDKMLGKINLTYTFYLWPFHLESSTSEKSVRNSHRAKENQTFSKTKSWQPKLKPALINHWNKIKLNCVLINKDKRHSREQGGQENRTAVSNG